MSYELYSRGSQEPQKMAVICPECGTRGEVLWFPAYSQTYNVPGTASGSSSRTDKKSEKVEGQCKECGYKFKPDDL